jgi:hypothetical protein
MPSFLTKSGYKITLKSYDENTFLLSIVDPNGDCKNIELDTGNITALSILIDSLMLEKS